MGMHVYDGDGARINVFDTSGAVVLSRRIPVSSYGFVWRGGIDSSGRIVDQQAFRRDTTLVWVIRVMNVDAAVIDTFDLPPCRFEPEPHYEFPRGSAQVPFAAGAAAWIDVATNSVWCAHSGRPAAYRYAFGDTTASDSLVSWATPARVTPEERAEQVDRLERFAKEAGGTHRCDAHSRREGSAARTETGPRRQSLDDYQRLGRRRRARVCDQWRVDCASPISRGRERVRVAGLARSPRLRGGRRLRRRAGGAEISRRTSLTTLRGWRACSPRRHEGREGFVMNHRDTENTEVSSRSYLWEAGHDVASEWHPQAAVVFLCGFSR